MRRGIAGFVASWCALVASCASPETRDQTVLDERDVEGVPVMSYTMEDVAAARELTVDTVPVFMVGRSDGAEGEVLYRVLAAVGLPDGGMVIADDNGTVLRKYDAEGRYLRSSGREGDGPGEYHRIGALGTLDDSVVVLDGRNRRVTVLDDSLRFVRSLRLPQEIGSMTLVLADELRALDAMSFAFMESELRGRGVLDRLPDGHHVVADTVSIRLLRPSGDTFVVADLLRAPGETESVRIERNSTATGGAHFSSVPLMDANGTEIVYAHASMFEIRRYDPDGQPNQVIRVAVPMRPVTEAEREEVREAQRRRERIMREDPPEVPEEMRRMMLERAGDEPVFADWHPVLGGLSLDGAGNVWVFPRAEDRAIVFDRAGALCGRYAFRSGRSVAPAPRARDLYIGDGYVIALVRDTTGFDRVAKYNLPRCPTSNR